MTHEKEKYERIKELKNSEHSMKFNSLEDFYAFVVGVLSKRKDIRIREYPMGITLAKIIVILSQLCEVKISESRVIVTIHKYGPEPFGNKEISSGRLFHNKRSDDIFRVSGHVANTNNGMRIDIIDNSKLRDVLKKDGYISHETYVDEVISAILDFKGDDNKIDLAYNVCFEREEYNFSHNILEMEAFSNVVTNSIWRNFLRARAKGIIPKKSELENYKVYAIIERIKNSEDNLIEINNIYNSAEVKEDLKYGSKNNLVVYFAIYFLNLMGVKTGTSKKNIENLCCLLSTYYINYKEEYLSLKEEKNKSEIMAKIKGIERAVGLGVESLEKQGAIEEDDKNIHNYVVLGYKIRVNINGNTKDKILPPLPELTDLKREISSINKYLKNEGFIGS
jgi:hypothetical protein